MTMGRIDSKHECPDREVPAAANRRRRRRAASSAVATAAAALLLAAGTATVSEAFNVPSSPSFSRGGFASRRAGGGARSYRGAAASFERRNGGGGGSAALLLASSSGEEVDERGEVPDGPTAPTPPEGDDAVVVGGSGLSRRSAVIRLVGLPVVGAATLLTATSLPANAAKAEIDKSGQLFSPKAAMMGGGGSDAARGIRLTERDRSSQGALTKKGAGLIQDVYDARFISYLSRFLLNNDPAAKGWWLDQAKKAEAEYKPDDDYSKIEAALREAEQLRFAGFAESVEVGLADYFVGPYGSYASVQAAKAGLRAAAPATSAAVAERRSGLAFLTDIFSGAGSNPVLQKQQGGKVRSKKKKEDDVLKLERQGVLNLFTLLKARYTTRDEKKQLALLFALMSDVRLQPTAGIQSLLGEVDDGSVSRIELDGVRKLKDDSNFRESSLEGGGYSLNSFPEVLVDPPPALGTGYKPARAAPVMQRTTRVLRVNVTDGGEGYGFAPAVTITQRGVRRVCDACAVLDREGRVESIVILDPGLGYGGGGTRNEAPVLPTVEIEAPRKSRKARPPTKTPQQRDGDGTMRTAKAVAELEYAITDVVILDEGNGYVTTQPPGIAIGPPDSYPDWFLSRAEHAPTRRGDDGDAIAASAAALAGNGGGVAARVTSMRCSFPSSGASLVDTSTIATIRSQMTLLDDADLRRVRLDPLGLLPSAVRPELGAAKPVFGPGLVVVAPSEGGGGTFRIPNLPDLPPRVSLPSPRYRAYDPLFGGVGTKPVTKGARDLSVGEYGRLALSGAVCTVAVRTLLNPLELVKTKIQLENDPELNEYAKAGMAAAPSGKRGAAAAASTASDAAKKKKGGTTTTTADEEGEAEAEEAQPGTLDMIRGLVDLRGPLALFQSADITFLASLMFGCFGFGATELFRRSFSMIFFEEGGGSGTGTELVLLLAAAVACVLTCLAATPFEMIRVKSMSLVEPKGWTEVLAEFVDEKRQDRMKVAMAGGSAVESSPEKGSASKASTMYATRETASEFNLKDLKRDDIAPLWGGFAPIVSRELPFAITKFLVFDLLAQLFVRLATAQQAAGGGAGALEPVQVGVGPTGLAISAFAGALAGIVGAFISHPADLILTLTSAAAKTSDGEEGDEASSSAEGDDESESEGGGGSGSSPDWRPILKDLLSKEGGVANLFTGLPARSLFFFLVIGLQFFLYDYVKGLFRVGSDDLTLVLDVFYAIRQGLVNMDS